MYYFNAEDFGKRIRKSRKARKLTQEQLADLLGIDRNHLGRIEIGMRACSIDLLISLSSELHVSTDYLLTGNANQYELQKEALLKSIHELEELVSMF